MIPIFYLPSLFNHKDFASAPGYVQLEPAIFPRGFIPIAVIIARFTTVN